MTLHGDGHNSRNYLYVEDVARAFDVILHRGTIGCIYNLGGTHELSNLDVAKHLIRMMYARGDGGEATSTLSASGSDDKARAEGEAEPDEDALFDQHITFVEDRAFNDLRYQIDSTRLRSLGWEERVSWEEGLRKTVDWYLENSNNWPSELVDAALTAHPRMVGVEGRLTGF